MTETLVEKGKLLAAEAKGFRFWIRGLMETSIAGGASSISAWLGLIGADQVGIDVPTMNWQSLGVIMGAGMLVQAANYLKNHPLWK